MSFIDLVVCDVYMYTFENRDGTNSLDGFYFVWFDENQRKEN